MTQNDSLTELINEESGLSTKEKEYLKNRVQDKSKKQSAIEATGCSEKQANRIANTIEDNPAFREKVGQVMKMAGMSMEFLLTEHFSLINNSKDAKVKLKSIKLAYKILGLMDKRTSSSKGGNSENHLHMYGDKDLSEVREEINEIKRERDKGEKKTTKS